MRGQVRLPHRQLASSWLSVSRRVFFLCSSRATLAPWPRSILFLLGKELVRLACLTFFPEKILAEGDALQPRRPSGNMTLLILLVLFMRRSHRCPCSAQRTVQWPTYPWPSTALEAYFSGLLWAPLIHAA